MHEQKAKYSKSGISSTQHKQPANRPTIHATPNIIFIPGRGEIGNPFIDILSKKREIQIRFHVYQENIPDNMRLQNKHKYGTIGFLPSKTPSCFFPSCHNPSVRPSVL